MQQKLFIISGPSGVGEDSVINGLGQYLDVERVITTTTREMRPGDIKDISYYFVSNEEFQKDVKAGKFVEYAQQYNGNFYGVTKKELDRVRQTGKIGLWKLEYKGVMRIKELFPEIISVLLTVPSLEILADRIRKREAKTGGNVSEEYIQERMEYTREWLKHSSIYDYIVINEEGKLKETIEKVADIIQKHIKTV